MEPELQQRFEQLEQKVDATYQAAEKTRKYILGLLVIAVITVILPMIGLVFVIPAFLSTMTAAYGL